MTWMRACWKCCCCTCTPSCGTEIFQGREVSRNSSRPLFITFSVAPMTKVETTTPIMRASCCFHGVAPMRKPVFRSCEVSPALEAATQTTPPMVMASAPKAGAVQPFTRKMAVVAISVAMVMPETGLAELPMSPTMRDATVTKRNPKITTRIDAAKFDSSVVCAPGTGWKVRKKNISSTSAAEPRTTTLMGRSRSVRSAAGLPAPLAELLRAGAQRADDRRHRPEQRDQAGGGHRARAHRPDVTRP